MGVIEQAYLRYDHLKNICRPNWSDAALQKLDQAFRFVLTAIGENQFSTGEYIVLHSLEVATIIAAEIGLEPDSVITGLLHNVMYAGLDKKVEPDELVHNFGPVIFSILEGMTSINKLGTDTVELHPENYRNLLMALAGDVRVILVKTADRLQVMRNLDICTEETRRRIVNETSHLYAPLAHRLGLYNINSEMLDLCLMYQKPADYNYISGRLKETETERENFVAEFVKPLEIPCVKKPSNSP